MVFEEVFPSLMVVNKDDQQEGEQLYKIEEYCTCSSEIVSLFLHYIKDYRIPYP